MISEEHKEKLKVLLLSLDGIEKYILCLEEPFEDNITQYRFALHIMCKILNKIMKHLPCKNDSKNIILKNINQVIKNI